MKNFVKVITQYNTSQKFLGTKIKMMEKNFKDLCKEYDCNISLLNVNFKKFNVQEEDKVMKEDIKELLKFQEAITKNTIGEILNEVAELYNTAQHNKNIIKILKGRIFAAYSVVSFLQEREDLFTSHYYTSLYRLVQVIQNMEKYIEEITQENAVLGIKTIEKKFKDLCEEYDNSISLLNFSLVVDFKSDAQEEDKVLLRSQAALAECMIVEIFNEVTELYKTTRHNKNITKILVECISEANSVISILQEKKDLFTSDFYTGLFQILQDMEEYIEEITPYDMVQNSLKTKTIEKKFSNLCKEYGSNISLLDLIEFKKFNAQVEDEVLKEDIRELLKSQATSAKNTIYKILNGVTELSNKTAQHDKKLAEILKERISVAQSAVGILLGRDDLFTSDYYINHTNLHGLVHVLQNMEKYVKEITKYAKYDTRQKFAEAKTIEEKFKDLCKGYDRNIGISLLNFNLAVDFKFNAQEEEKVLLKFQAALAKSMIDEILKEVTKLYETAQHNKNITEILKKRISAAHSAVIILLERDDLFTLDYYTSHTNLHGLVYILRNMEKYVEEMTQYDTKQMFLEAKTIKEKFKNLCKEYDDSISISLLNFNFAVDFKFSVQEEEKVLLKFKAALAESIINEILNEVMELYITAQHNKNITKILMECISTACFAVNNLQAREVFALSISDYYTNLQKLVQVSQDMKKYIEEITQYITVQEFSGSEPIERKFKDLRQRYDSSNNLLKFEKFNTQEEGKVLKEDIEELLKFQTALAESMTDTNMDYIYFDQFVPLIKDVADILRNVTDLYYMTQQNKQIIKILIERIASANFAVSIYILQENYSCTLKDYTSLQKLVRVLRDMKEYIEEITQYNTVQKFSGAESIEKNFKDLRKEYDTSIGLLNFVDFKKLNAQEEDKILKEDIEKLLKFQATSKNMGDRKQNVNEKLKLVIKQVTMQDTNQNKPGEPPLPFEDYEKTDDYRSGRLRKYVIIETKEEFAFKTVKDEHINQVKNQVTILKKLEHCQNIIHFYGYTYDGDKYYFVTEWAENGNLREYISKNGQNIETNLKLRFAYDIAKGLNFLNAVKILHQDIRSENIIITDHGVAKITNFKLHSADTVDIEVNKECARYSAPEMLSTGKGLDKDKKKIYDTKCEVYSFGVLLWEIAECRIPCEQFEDIKEITKEVTNGYLEKFSPGTAIPKEYQDLVRKAIAQDPDHRPTFAKTLIVLRDLQNILNIRELSLWVKDAIKKKLIKYIKWNELTNISIIGSGHFGSVSKARWSNTNNYVVLKKLYNSNDIQKDAFQHEINMQNRARTCENIICFIGITQEPNDNYCIVMEYADGGDLRDYLKKKILSLNWVNKYQLAFDITNGVHYLHKENILHRDLHAKNIVIHKGRAKITDFGYAKSEETQTKIHKGVFGMAPYVAPELFNFKSQLSSFSKKTDIYSLGVLLWEISSGKPPFKDYESENLLIMKICQGLRETVIENTPTDYCKLYTDCWNEDPEKRPIIEDVYDKLKNILPNSDAITEDKNVDNKDIDGSSSATFDDDDDDLKHDFTKQS